MSKEENQEMYESMCEDLRSGECARIDSPATGFDQVTVCRKMLGVIDADRYDSRGFGKAPEGVFRSHVHALRAIQTEFARIGFFGNVYLVNERGNVTLINPRNGKEISSWV